MPLGPILPGRIPSSLVARRLQGNLQTSSLQLAQLQDQVASGKRFSLPSESPAAAVRAIVLQKSLEQNVTLRGSVNTGKSFLAASEQSLQNVSTALNTAKGYLLAGVGNNVTDQERQALANDVRALIQGVLGSANDKFRGRYLFAGSQTQTAPFQARDDGTIEYRGDALAINSLVDLDFTVATGIDGLTAFGAVASVETNDLNPAVTLSTQLTDLHNGVGVELGSITVTLDNGGTPQTETIDLSSATTLEDVQTRLQNAFAGGPLTLTVDLDPATNHGFRLTPSAGTVSVSEVTGGTTAAQLGIASAATAVINGRDLNPQITPLTPLAALNGGTGIGATTGTGLRIVQGSAVATIDLDGLTTIEDLFNAVERSPLQLSTEISSNGNGLEFASRLSGVDFAIGENTGQNATNLGLRTFTANTPLSELNGGLGVPREPISALEITRRDGLTVTVDLANANSVQDVIDAVNAVDPGVLTASLNAVGNGIQLIDDDGVSTGPLSVADSQLSRALGLNGIESGTNRTVPLAGRDVNPRQADGLFDILVRLEGALRNSDDAELARLQPRLDEEVSRFNVMRGEIGSRLKSLEEIESRLLDREVKLREDLSIEHDSDIAEVVTQVTQIQSTLEATLSIAAQTSRLTLLSFL